MYNFDILRYRDNLKKDVCGTYDFLDVTRKMDLHVQHFVIYFLSIKLHSTVQNILPFYTLQNIQILHFEFIVIASVLEMVHPK